MEAIEIWLSKQAYPLELEVKVREDFTTMEKDGASILLA